MRTPLLHLSTLLAAAWLVAANLGTPDPLLGEGRHRYSWEQDWIKLPKGMTLGNTHGCMVVDQEQNLYINTDSSNAIVVVSPEGEFVKGWGEEFGAGMHGMCISKEGEQEFLYLAHLGSHAVYKTTLDGEVLWKIEWPEESGKYERAGEYRPTGVAVAPNGHIYVADGYGKSWIHRFDENQQYLESFGGPGTAPGQFRTPHGITLDTRGDRPVLVVADRENGRLQVYSLECELLSVIHGMLRRPCSVFQHGTDLVVADLAGRVTILNLKNELVCQLGDNPVAEQRATNGVEPKLWRDGVFISPHSASFDRAGNLYVMDWNRWGRVNRLTRLQ